MAKRQSRRSVSFRAEVFVRLHDAAVADGTPLSAFVESIVTAALDRASVPAVSRDDALRRLGAWSSRSRVDPEERIENLRREAFGS